MFHLFPHGIVSSGLSDTLAYRQDCHRHSGFSKTFFFPQQFASKNAQLLSDTSTSYIQDI